MGRMRAVRKVAGSYASSLASLSFNFGGLVAGIMLATSLDVMASVRWGVLLFPSIISVRGAIGGLFSGRISTALHIGTIRPSMRGNTKHLWILYDSTTVLSLIMGLVLWAFGCAFGVLFAELTMIDLLYMLLAILTTLAISVLFVSPATALVSIESMKRGADPDVSTYPIISTVADILVTMTYILVVSALRFSWSLGVFTVISVLFVLSCVVLLWIDRDEPDMITTLRESLMVLPLIAFFVNISGSTLDRIGTVITNEPAIYMIYPAIIDTVGDVGSVVGSTATTKLNLGTAHSSLRLFKDQLSEIAGTWSASLTLFVAYALISFSAVGLNTGTSLSVLIMRISLTNLMAVGIGVVISLLMALGTFRRGWDPDNFVIPVESTFADAVTSLSLFAATLLVWL
ncbi:MAG: magnesium transporter [Candidatus Thorarchaeota archaeon]|nr:magnesium transporter [Candidatus Thorarchaeota archaeon]